MRRLSTGLSLDWRAGPGAALFCLHGIGGNSASFAPQLEHFDGVRAIGAWDMPGYGDSRPLPSMSFAALAQAVVAALDELGQARAVLVGQSIGGMVAQEVAHRYPERVAALVLIGTTPSFGGRDETFKEKFLQARLAPLDAGETMQTLAPQFVPQIVGRAAGDAVIAAATASMSVVGNDAYRATIECLVTFNRRAELAQLSMPSLLIAGGEDNNAPARTMQKMAETMPDARYHCIESAGHLINLEAGPACNALIHDFVGELS